MVRILLLLVAADVAVELAPVLIHSRDARLTVFVLGCVFLALPVLGCAGPRRGAARGLYQRRLRDGPSGR
jgi:hypothetical protein